MRKRTVLATLAAVAGAACAGEAPETEVEEVPTGDVESAAPAEVDPSSLEAWQVRLDRDTGSEDFIMSDEGQEMTISTGPAGITWRPADLVEQGNYTARATFRQVEAPPGHREAYGLLIGGRHLDAPDQRYTYFLIRGTGDVLVKRRDGEQTSTLVDWAPSDAVAAVRGQGQAAENTLEVRVRGDSVHFAVNDQVVETLPADEVDPYGLVGLRVNHRLDLEVRDYEVEGAEGRGSG